MPEPQTSTDNEPPRGWLARLWGGTTNAASSAGDAISGSMRFVAGGATAVTGSIKGATSTGIQAVRGATVDRLTDGMERASQRLARRILALLARLALVLSFATVASVLLLVGLFAAFGVELLEFVDRGTLLNSIALHTIAIGAIVVLVRAISVVAETRAGDGEHSRDVAYVLPLALGFAGPAFWYLSAELALLATSLFVALVAALMRLSRTLMLIAAALAFLALGFARAWTLYTGEPSALLARNGRIEPFQIIIAGDRGMLGLTGEPRVAELVPWEHIQGLKARRIGGLLNLLGTPSRPPPRPGK